jgi:hypothetical protein
VAGAAEVEMHQNRIRRGLTRGVLDVELETNDVGDPVAVDYLAVDEALWFLGEQWPTARKNPPPHP